MKLEILSDIANKMVTPGKGILAMDESHPTCNNRFEKLNIPTTEENRRVYRNMLVTTSGLSDFISGAILFDETIKQTTLSEIPFPKYLYDNGIIPGIKVDAGAKELAGHSGEKVTEGLDGLRERLLEYKKLGAMFAKWRAVITIFDSAPSMACIEANAHGLARYAALCQETDIVPIVEPEVLMDGDHSIERSLEVTELTQAVVFDQLKKQNVAIEGIVLKPSMVISGSTAKNRANIQTVAEQTVNCLKKTVPAELPGIAFLSGGQTDEEASAHLDAINRISGSPWALTFSYGRALQQTAMQTWAGIDKNIEAAQKAIYKRAKLNSAACTGTYDASLEKEAA
jgi:fructose-bisphosphate aldolase class I